MPTFCGHCQKPFDQSHPLTLTECARKTDKPSKRYQVEYAGLHYWRVTDSWTNASKGVYPDKAKAQARARTLNSRAQPVHSRQGGK